MRFSSPFRALGALVLIAVLGGFAGALAAPPPPPVISDSLLFREHGIRMTVSPLSQTFTRKITARWGAAADALGSATSYRVRWTVWLPTLADARTVERIVPTLSDTLTVDVPLAPDSSLVTVSAWARRRGAESRDSVYASRGFNRADAPPPPPGPVVLDTVVQLMMFTPSATNSVAVADSLETCIAYRSAAGLVGVLSTLARSPQPGENVAALAPTYGACRQAAVQRYGALTGMDFFGYPEPQVPSCVYPRSALAPVRCDTTKVGVRPALLRTHSAT